MARQSRTLEQGKANLEASIGTIGTRYRQGVSEADWQGPSTTQESEDNWNAGVAEASAADRRRAGVRRVGNDGYRQGAMEKGANNIGPGVRRGLDKWVEGYGPVKQRIDAIKRTMPAKTRDAETNIDQRLKPIVRAMQARS